MSNSKPSYYRGRLQKDTVKVTVKIPTYVKELVEVIFYCPDPTYGIPLFNQPADPYKWVTFDSCSYSRQVRLVTVNIDSLSLSDFLSGVWCRNGCVPTCSDPYYSSIFEDKNIVTFKLPPGKYKWTAENPVNNLEGWPNVTPAFVDFFKTVHRVEGTVTIPPWAKCVTQPVYF